MQIPKQQRKKDRATLMILAFACLVPAVLFHGGRGPAGGSSISLIACLSSVFLCIISLLPGPASRAAGFWTRFGAFLADINSRILLAVIFYLVLTPAAFLYRLLSDGSVDIPDKRTASPASFWRERNITYCKKDLEKVW